MHFAPLSISAYKFKCFFSMAKYFNETARAKNINFLKSHKKKAKNVVAWFCRIFPLCKSSGADPDFANICHCKIQNARRQQIQTGRASSTPQKKRRRGRNYLTTSFRVFSPSVAAVSRKKKCFLDKGGWRVGTQFLKPVSSSENHRQTIRNEFFLLFLRSEKKHPSKSPDTKPSDRKLVVWLT